MEARGSQVTRSTLGGWRFAAVGENEWAPRADVLTPSSTAWGCPSRRMTEALVYTSAYSPVLRLSRNSASVLWLPVCLNSAKTPEAFARWSSSSNEEKLRASIS